MGGEDEEPVDMDELEDISLTAEEIEEAYGEDAEILSNFKGAYPQCKMFRNANTGAVYLSYNGALHWIPNPPTFKNLFKPVMWNKWVNQPHNLLSAANYGTQIKPSASLGKGDKTPAVYLFSYKAHHIANVKTFNTCGFNWQMIQTYPQAKVNAFPKGHDIDSTLY